MTSRSSITVFQGKPIHGFGKEKEKEKDPENSL
jgi:hypothetical protein